MTVCVAVKVVSELLVTLAALPPSSTTGVAMASLASMVTVMVSPALALVVSALLETILTEVRVGFVVSTVTVVESVVDVTAVPELPVASEKWMCKDMLPSLLVL